jgi:hypothetical protein
LTKPPGWGYIGVEGRKMTGWDVLDKVLNSFPPLVLALMLVAVLVSFVIFMVGFAKHGTNFVKYGFKQKEMGDLVQKIDNLRTEFKSDFTNLRTEFKNDFTNLRAEFKSDLAGLHTEFKNDLAGLRTEFKSDLAGLHTEFKNDLEVIKVNHFGHLKDFLSELTSILLDKGVINNQDKARLDNKLRGM